MKFSAIPKGKRAERRASFPYPNEAGEIVDRPFIVVPLSVGEEAEVFSFADTYAKAHGLKTPQQTDPLYHVGVQLKTVQLSAFDPDSAEGARERMFASTEEIESRLDRETLTYVYVICDEWQDTCSPSIRKITDDAMLEGIRILGAGGADADAFLDSLGPALRRIYMLCMARQCVTSLERSSSSSGTTRSPGAKVSPATAKTKPKRSRNTSRSPKRSRRTDER